MKIKYAFGVILMILLSGVMSSGCAKTKDNVSESIDLFKSSSDLIFETKISPNEDYAENKNDIVYYEVKIYQNEDNVISVFANSNSAFFDELYYQIEYDTTISKDNVSVEWVTMMGNPQPTKDDQIALADIKMFSENEVYSQRKINFVKKAVEIMVDTINEK